SLSPSRPGTVAVWLDKKSLFGCCRFPLKLLLFPWSISALSQIFAHSEHKEVKMDSQTIAYVNCRFYTMRNPGEQVESDVVRSGTITNSSTLEKALCLAAKNWVDHAVKTYLPGLIDDHQHVQTYARNLMKVDLSGARSIGEVQSLLRDRASRTPKGKLILGTG